MPLAPESCKTMGCRRLAFVLVLALACSEAAAAPEQIDIPDGGLALHAMLYRPEGPGPFPAVVALHDCGGLTQRPNAEAQLYSKWADKLVADGFVVVFPDSFGSRGLGSQCREHHRTVHAWRERVGDANAARLWLEKQSYVRRDHPAALGGPSRRGRFPLRRCVLPELPPSLAERVERASPCLDSHRQRRRLDPGPDMPTDGRRRPRPQRAHPTRRLSGGASRIRPRQFPDQAAYWARQY